MKHLPVLLHAWSPWLSLFPDELAASLGTLLLRLAPLLGPVRRHAAPQALEPAGIGDIVRRGSYERLLISEWAVADAAPDEFLRRAANGELLFTGPEPANSQQSLRSVVLFDAGPAQLGEARLAHLAMFILLARRAAQEGAEFQWGVLQVPGKLHAGQDEAALRTLLDARTWAALDADGLQTWNAALDGGAADCWLVGDAGAPVPAPVHARVLVRRSWLADELEVTLAQRRGSRTVALPLPRPDDSVRLLRRPFDGAPKNAAPLRMPDGIHSLKRAPLFGSKRGWLAVLMVDRSVTAYHVPDSPNAKAGRARKIGQLHDIDHIIAAGLFQKTLGRVALHEGRLHITGFPGYFFQHSANAPLPLPAPDRFEAVPGTLRWMPAFHLLQRTPGRGIFEQVCVLDKSGRLVAWTRTSKGSQVPDTTTFDVLASDVVAAVQQGAALLYAVARGGRTNLYSLAPGTNAPVHLYALENAGQRFLFGDAKSWDHGQGRYAMQIEDGVWLVGDRRGAMRLPVDAKCTVLGVAHAAHGNTPRLLVLDANRTRFASHSDAGTHTVFNATEPVAQASFDPTTRQLAWLGKKSGALTVLDIDSAQVLLRAVPREGDELAR